MWKEDTLNWSSNIPFRVNKFLETGGIIHRFFYVLFSIVPFIIQLSPFSFIKLFQVWNLLALH